MDLPELPTTITNPTIPSKVPHQVPEVKQAIFHGEIHVRSPLETQGECPKNVVIIALDESPFSQHALRWAMDNLINEKRDQVVLVQIRDIPIVPYGLVSAQEYAHLIRNIDAESRNDSRKLLVKALETVQSRNTNQHCKALSISAEVRDGLLAVCTELKAQTLVVGSRGMGMIKRAVIGSVSDYMVHYAPCSVIVVKEDADLHKKGTK